jgi:hypothetical protein
VAFDQYLAIAHRRDEARPARDGAGAGSLVPLNLAPESEKRVRVDVLRFDFFDKSNLNQKVRTRNTAAF